MTTNAPPETPAMNDVVSDIRLPIVWYNEATPAPNDPDLVRGLIGAKSLVLIWGPPKSGKSFVALDLALHIAAGHPWCGREVRAGTVVYIAAQGGRSIQHRLAAARRGFGDEEIPLAAVPRAVSLLDDRELSMLETTLRDIEQQRGHIAAIFVDSLSRTATGADENASGDMTKYIDVLDRLRETFEATVVVIHESGKNEWRGVRGHSVLVAAVDTGIRVSDQEIVFELQRDRPAGDRFMFDLGPLRTREADLTTCGFVRVHSSRSEHHDPHQAGAREESLGPSALIEVLGKTGSKGT